MRAKGGRIFFKEGAAFTGTQVTDPVNVSLGDTLSFHFIWTGTPTTTTKLQVSNKPSDDRDDSAASTDWYDDPDFTPVNAPAGSASNEMFVVGNAGCAFYRLHFVTTSTGTAEVHVAIKDEK